MLFIYGISWVPVVIDGDWGICFASPKKIKPVNPKGNQSWIFIGRTDAEAEAPILWPPDVKNWPLGKDPDAGKDWRWEEKGTTEEEMASLTQWTWVWVSSGSWWWTGKSMESQRVGHDWEAELNFLEKCSAFQAFLAHLLKSTLISLFWSRCLHMIIMESLCVLMAMLQDTSVHDNLWVLTGLCPKLIDLALGHPHTTSNWSHRSSPIH